ncbi:Uu.00g012980.m01.CDS01 [Anthostomella pinea]|uniref:Uu.00g012980.m01.CDS01 n=1 Tax=Anthostomella pinea TaxID=933095 RepID=A0AAI8VY05_9PEZI|nr:Uu.00g012980.m01.CDS01 [Anthostomella pinea]
MSSTFMAPGIYSPFTRPSNTLWLNMRNADDIFLSSFSFTIDTACSSSIYALHQALNAIKAGDCDSAIVASSNLILSPELHIAAAKSGVLSPTATCHTFDASADGYGRAEAANAIYIKPLSAAVRDGNPIRAVVRGSAVNASGKTPGISLPSGWLQEVVMRKAYANAKLNFAETDYVECHGTGTPKRADLDNDNPWVKTNVGHSEGSSALTSILKVVEAFEKGQIPPSQGIVKLNPKWFLAEHNLKVAQEVEEWPRAVRRASINSFGYGGPNAHVILESPESYLGHNYLSKGGFAADDPSERDGQTLMVLPVSAASPKSLEMLVAQVAQAVAQSHDTESPQSLAHTLVNGRDHLQHRSFILTKLEEGLGRLMDATAVPRQAVSPPPFAFVFTGQGAQYAGMAKELLSTSQNFRHTIRRLDCILQGLPPVHVPKWTLEQTLLNGSNSRINEVTRSQPLCTAVQIGLVNLLRSWGVQSTSVLGHSSGEIAAAYTAGHLTSKQAILVAYFRGLAVGKLRSKGAMVAAGLAPDEANLLIKSKGLESQVRGENEFARSLGTGGRAYHSYMMEEVGKLYEGLLAPYFGSEDSDDEGDACVPAMQARMYYSVGHDPQHLGVIDSQTYMPAYWRKNLEQPVQFSAAVGNLVAGDKDVHLIEICPHATLKGPIKQIRTGLGMSEVSLPYSATLVRGQDADLCMKMLAGALFTHCYQTLRWDAVDGLPRSGLRILHELAPYPWDYSGGLLWSEPRASLEMRNRRHLRHELLGTLALTGNDHKLEDQIVFLATGYMGLAIEALSQMTDAKEKPAAQLAFEFRNVNISAALNIADEDRDVYLSAKDLELHNTMSRRKISNTNSSGDWHDYAVSSWLAGRTTVHCTGSIRLAERAEKDDGVALQNTEAFDTWSTGRWYTKWHEEGLCFGPHFQSLTSLQTDGGRRRREAIGTTRLQPAITGGSYYPVHPVTIDAALQAAILSTTAGHVPSLKTWLPVFIEECRIQPPQFTTDADSEEATGEIQSQSWETGLSSRRIDGTMRDSRSEGDSSSSNDVTDVFTKRQPTLRVNWKPDCLRLGPESQGQLREYVTGFVDEQHDDMRDESLAVMTALLDLAGHKNPRFGSWSSTTWRWKGIVTAKKDLVYATALYAINDRAHLRAVESVQIHAGSGGLGIAAITLARRLGAVVYTTVGSQTKRDYLVNELGVPASHIFSSRDASLVQVVKQATGGHGVDVVINSLVGDLVHESWRCLSEFGGRFVEVGKRELVDSGKLDIRVFLRGATFTALDLSELFYATDPFHRATWDRLMAETLDLYRSGEIAPLPMKVFDVGQVAQAYRYFASKERVAKVVISMEDTRQTRVPVAPATYQSVFDPEKVYLLVGCLGGLGRSLSCFMMARGCRYFVFLGRSGADKPSAQQLVSRLEKAGATVGIVRGDVSSASDVTAAVSACLAMCRRIGGVIPAAMGLHEALFTKMPCEAWHTGIDPNNEPDFFLLTSSVSGTVGTATEANYCAANGFLDAFARWRRSRGQAGISIGLGMISEVGYLHENLEIEALLLRKGIQPLNEEEFLQGLEPAAIRQLSAQGFGVTSHGVLVEARASLLLASLLAEKEAAAGVSQKGHAAVVAAAPWFKDAPAAVSAALAPEADAETLHEAVLRLMKKRFSNLILMPADRLWGR